ncbi:hypothetical protein GFK26_14230 [Variovorax paradoxus]|uniref:ESPR domain-containing protein n=1 Tax=Variovorax paradoxus TaxID=34073 RepID=A0A5Q0M3K5_VARPD|nr:ESPR domain-containing protein [Variovorax paradoxus]QFZ83828.1 hypothetical protein GFK26_14230 [Variovorax paradoxus]
MNKSYRSIWNEALGAWVAASELTSARGKKSKSRVATVAALVVAERRRGMGWGVGSIRAQREYGNR